MDRLRREDDVKGRQTKKAQDAEQSLLSKVHLGPQNYRMEAMCSINSLESVVV